MALPEYVLRSYRGGCTYLTLTETIGAGTLSIPVTGTLTNWPTKTLAATTGPFVICLTRGTAKEEKVLCSSLAKNTGIITVWSTGTQTGRGYDTTSAHTHAPTSTVQQVVLVWSAAEAREANRAANAILGAPTAHSTSATAKANETSICTSGITLTLPASPLDGTRNAVLAASGTTVVKAGTGSTITWGTTGHSSVSVPAGMSISLVYHATVWYATATSGAQRIVTPTVPVLLDTVAVGSAPPATATIISRTGSFTVKVANTAGGWSWNMPHAFSHGYTPIICAGDDASALAAVAIVLANCTLSALDGVAFSSAGGLPKTSLIRINYTVVGA